VGRNGGTCGLAHEVSLRATQPQVPGHFPVQFTESPTFWL
jgi:hypothetical protein